MCRRQQCVLNPAVVLCCVVCDHCTALQVTAVSDVNAALVNEGGLDIKVLRHHLGKGE